jgi:hypothetical protein
MHRLPKESIKGQVGLNMLSAHHAKQTINAFTVGVLVVWDMTLNNCCGMAELGWTTSAGQIDRMKKRK